jgi:hypothetical protein
LFCQLAYSPPPLPPVDTPMASIHFRPKQISLRPRDRLGKKASILAMQFGPHAQETKFTKGFPEADTCRKCAGSLTDRPRYHGCNMQFARLLSATFQVWRDPASIPLRQALQHTCASMYLERAVLTCADVTVILTSLLIHCCLHGFASPDVGVHPKAPTTTSPILALACEFLCDIPFAPFTHHFLLM